VTYLKFNGIFFDATGVLHRGIEANCSAPNYDCVDVGFGPPYPRFLTFSNGRVANAPESGFHGLAESHFSNMEVDHNGNSGYDHGYYLSSSNNIIENGNIHHNSGWGVQLYHVTARQDDNIVRGNWIHDNGQSIKQNMYRPGGAGIVHW